MMAGREEIRDGSFEWKIYRFMEKVGESKQSNEFTFGPSNAYLYIPASSINDTSGFYIAAYSVGLLLHNKGIARFLSKTIFKMCLMNRYGQACMSLKGTAKILAHLPFFVPQSYLQENAQDLLPERALTSRLSWYQKDKKRERNTQAILSPGSSSSAILQRSTQTEPPSTRDNYSNTEKEPTTLLETLSKDFACFYDNKTDTDCVLRVCDTQFPVHRQVLAARSEVFAAMFRHDTSENRSGVVDIPDVDAAVLGDVLYYVYSGHIRGLSTDTSVPMYAVADKYALIELRDICLNFLMHNLTMENVCDAAILSHSNGEIGLEERVVQFIQAELKELVETENWKQFLSTKSVLASRLLCAALMASREEIKKLSAK